MSGKTLKTKEDVMTKEEIIKILEEEIKATLTEIAFLKTIPKEKGHHQGFSQSQVIKNSSERIANQILGLLEKEFEKRIPNVKSINPSYFRNVIKQLLK